MNDYTHIVAALVNFWHIYWHLLLTYWCVNGHCMRPATGSWIRRSKLVRLRLASGTSATGSCREQAPKIGLCHLLPNGFSVVVDPWQNAANWWGSVCHVFDWMFSMIWLCSFHKTTNQTCQQKIEKKNIKSCEINLDLGDNMPISTDVQFVPMVCFRHSKTHSREAFCWLRWIHISVFGFRFQHFVWSDASYFWWRSDKKGTIVPSTEKFLSPT